MKTNKKTNISGSIEVYISFIWQTRLSKAMYNNRRPKVAGTATERRSDKGRFTRSISHWKTKLRHDISHQGQDCIWINSLSKLEVRVHSDWTTLCKVRIQNWFTLNLGPDSLWSLKSWWHTQRVSGSLASWINIQFCTFNPPPNHPQTKLAKTLFSPSQLARGEGSGTKWLPCITQVGAAYWWRLRRVSLSSR